MSRTRQIQTLGRSPSSIDTTSLKTVAAGKSDTLKQARSSITELSFHGGRVLGSSGAAIGFVKQIAMLRFGILFDDEAIDGGLQVNQRATS